MQKALGTPRTRFWFRPNSPLCSLITLNYSTTANLPALPRLPIQKASPDVDLLVRFIREASSPGWSNYGCSHLHCSVLKHGLASHAYVSSSLLHSYVGIGSLEDARKLLDEIPDPDVVLWNALISGNLVSWNAMISGFGHNACSHCKAPLDTAIWFFKSMVNDYGIEPTVEHCCSIIRVMGQSGELWRAVKLIYRLGFGSCGSVWRALLGACACSAQDLKVAEVAAGKVIELSGDEDYVYVALSNIYGFLGKWSDKGDIRRLMRLREVQKGAGSSWIQV
ncbi:hypothetical protein MLD38_015469 [Melastoma candidum]|uniref:Uncharacterized protein n=1 Tax=Melastoma candidum TaxID=119954 RepID=A0ACB9RKE7_9MYRT|nr:hypothetical protein MLD38_015469 [Melastoma candidum]